LFSGNVMQKYGYASEADSMFWYSFTILPGMIFYGLNDL
jgi:hypothetical protein